MARGEIRHWAQFTRPELSVAFKITEIYWIFLQFLLVHHLHERRDKHSAYSSPKLFPNILEGMMLFESLGWF